MLVHVCDEFTPSEAGLYNLDNLAKTYNVDLINFRCSPQQFISETRKSFFEELHPLKWIEQQLYAKPLEIAEALTRSGAIDIIVVDSVAALVPKAEIDGDMGDAHVGLQARLMSQALRKLAGVINKSKTVIIFINQLREKVGIMFGNPETTPGGRALKFYASVRLDIRKIENIKVDGEVTGARARVKIIKNKVAPPFREAEFDIVYGKGISKEGNILDLAVNLNLVEKAGAWFSYNGEKIGQGRENAKQYIREHQDVAKELETKIRDNFMQAFKKSLGEDEEDKEQEEKTQEE